MASFVRSSRTWMCGMAAQLLLRDLSALTPFEWVSKCFVKCTG